MCEQYGSLCAMCKKGLKHEAKPVKPHKGKIWRSHWSPAMGARTPQHAREIAARCTAVGADVKFQYGTHGPLKVNSNSHQKQLMKVAHADQGKMVNFDSYN